MKSVHIAFAVVMLPLLNLCEEKYLLIFWYMYIRTQVHICTHIYIFIIFLFISSLVSYILPNARCELFFKNDFVIEGKQK